MDPSSPEFQEAQHRAIEFYDAEHGLSNEERQELESFFRRSMAAVTTCSTLGLLIGGGLPILFRRGKKINAVSVGWGGVLGSMVSTWGVAPSLYQREVGLAKDKYGSESRIYNVIQHTPHGVFRSLFWASYFRETIKHPEHKIKDPRTVDPRFQPVVDDNTAWAKVRKEEHDENPPSSANSAQTPSSLFDIDPSLPDKQTPAPAPTSAWERVRESNSK
ncbi:hypothetical protein OGAPHI_001736 [Ogataea philodendri]|uniref:Transmembrane protein n=1 Tax=Ogataea philodendri TaxID=1378263 RepID=A0A9P8P9Q0_9ASCO|nr:uncharacterized protein OGAPHI_001736 [Ogataea philodendri]KAH3667982.1 hypothetical protein OGAPHI_001736 [Ogataea philodendri]